MNILFVITSTAFFLWIFRNTLFWVWLWQVKEYRLDRLLTHLKEAHQGRMLLFSPLNLFKWFLILSYTFVIFSEQAMFPYSIVILLVYVYEAISFGHAMLTRRVKRPVFTMKAILLVFFTVSSIYGLYTLGIIQQGFLWLLLLDKIMVFFIAFFVFFLSIPTMLFEDYKIDLAIKKRQSFPDLTVIGITGSFGKSSTKEYTAQILSKKFSVVKTLGTNNTPIGLSNTVLSKLNPTTQILVAEMGAYKRGEIAQLCEIAKPTIGIITAVASQHLSLFGSKEMLAKTKFELIQSLPADGLALFNGNNAGAMDLAKKTKRKKIIYATVSSGEKQNPGITASRIRVEKDSVSFTVSLNKKLVVFKTPLIGAHVIENVLPGIYLGHMLGMNEKQLKDAVGSLQPLPKTMTVHTSVLGTILIDDTFNVNPDGVIAAMEYANLYKGKKILVLEPLIELGTYAKQEHYRIGEALAHTCDFIFMTKKNFYNDVMLGIDAKKGTCTVVVAKPSRIAKFINTKTKKSDIVIFEGKEAAVVLHSVV